MLFFVVIFLGFEACSIIKSSSLHKSISVDDVHSIVVNNSSIKNTEEIRNIVKWFNSIYNINENSDFSGTTGTSILEITLKSDKKIIISYPGRVNQDFEIQRENGQGKWVSYWGNQPDIRKMLENNTPAQ